MKVVHEITYPNGKIYIGQDRTGSINSPNSLFIAADFTRARSERFTVTGEILGGAERSDVDAHRLRPG